MDSAVSPRCSKVGCSAVQYSPVQNSLGECSLVQCSTVYCSGNAVQFSAGRRHLEAVTRWPRDAGGIKMHPLPCTLQFYCTVHNCNSTSN